MKELTFRYRLRLTVDTPISGHFFTLRCTPVSDERQRIEALQQQVSPCDFLSKGVDQWNNVLLYGRCSGAHSLFEANVAGHAVTGLSDCIPGGNPMRDGLFRFATPLTQPDDALSAFAAELRLTGSDVPEQAAGVMEAVHSHLRYQPGVTTVHTTAADAFRQGCGVCQDYSHVMLAVLRAQGIPARYVVGMLLGEGRSHAWVEVLHKGSWYAFDPTNCTVVTDQHIKLSHGRDYWDGTINRGIFRGSAVQNAEISVAVTEA